MKPVKILLILTLSSLVSCSQCRKDKKAVLVYLDMTKSVEKEDFNKTLGKVRALYEQMNSGDEFIIIPVLDHPSRGSICNFQLPHKNQDGLTKTSEKYELKRKARGDSCLLELMNFYETSITDPAIRTSCIIGTLQSANSMLQRSSGDSTQRFLFYFSDLLEDCGSKDSPSGGLIFESSRKMKYNVAVKRLEEHYQPKFNLYKTVGTQLYFITASSYPTTANCWPTHQVERIWRENILPKVGYNQSAVQQVYFGPEVPSRIFD